jgi:hypothetical protein
MRLAFFGLIVPVFVSSFAFGASLDCLERITPALDVTGEVEPVREDYSRSLAELRKQAEKPPTLVTFGSLQASIELAGGLGATAPERNEGRWCSRIFGMRVRVLLKERVLFVAREAANDPCLLNAVLDHERRHDTFDHVWVKEAVSHVRTTLRPLVEQLGTITGSTESEIEVERKRLLAPLWAKVLALDLSRDRLRRHAEAVDTAEEIARFYRSCAAVEAFVEETRNTLCRQPSLLTPEQRAQCSR